MSEFNGVKWVPVTEILRNLSYSCDLGDWEDYTDITDDAADNTGLLKAIIARKSNDTGFGYLVESIMEHGFSEEGAIGWDGISLENGHHRFVAAVLLCLDEVPTVSGWGFEWDGAPEEARYTHNSRGRELYPIGVEV